MKEGIFTMKLIDEIKMLFIKLPEEKRIIISDEMIHKYQNTCNHGKDDNRNALLHINKSLSLGKVVGKSFGYVYIGYFDMVYKIKGNVLVDIIRVKHSKARCSYTYIDELVKEKWNRKYGIVSNED